MSGAILAAAVLTLHSVEEPTAVGLLQTRLAHPAVLAAVALVTAILDQQLERHGRHGGCRALQGGDRASPVAWGARHLGEWEASSLALVVIVARGTGEGGDEARADEGGNSEGGRVARGVDCHLDVHVLQSGAHGVQRWAAGEVVHG